MKGIIIGHTVANRYRIDTFIGRGGMAEVYKVWDLRRNTYLAMKVLYEDLAIDRVFMRRFRREAQTLAKLQHPNIMRFYGLEQDGQLAFMLLELLEGETLKRKIFDARGPFSTGQILTVIRSICGALQFAHNEGMIHCDIKPGNIMIDNTGRVLLADFGIARLADAATATMVGMGTPAYMAPEQARGLDPTPQTDIYAMGVVLYEMLTGGERPFTGEQARTTGSTSEKVRWEQMHLEPPSPRNYNTDITDELEAAVLKCLAKDTRQRYRTALDLQNAIELAMGGDAEKSEQPVPAFEPIIPTTQVCPNCGQSLELNWQTCPACGQKIPAKRQEAYPDTAKVDGKSTRRVSLRGYLLRIGILLTLILIVGIAVYYVLGVQDKDQLAQAELERSSEQLISTTDSLTKLTKSSIATTTAPTVTIRSPSTEQESQPAAGSPLKEDATPTLVEPTHTPTAPPTPTPEPTRPVIGGADKIAYINEGDIWVANLDGSDLIRLTEDGTTKHNLQWTPDGEAIVYISGNCAISVQIVTGRTDIITCFNFVDLFTAFELSPDNKYVAISLDNQMYIVPNDLDRLNQVRTRTDLSGMAECEHFAPYERNFVKMVRWSNDRKIIAAELLANLGTGKRADIIQLIPVDSCIPNPKAIDNFPPPRFEMRGYAENPIIQNFDWDGISLFTLTNNIRNDGFGDLYFYNTELHKARFEVNPIKDKCCYRDPHWSPDGSHVVLAYQDYMGGANSVTQLCLIPYGTMGTGAHYQPLPLPDITNPREKPNPILRPAQVQ